MVAVAPASDVAGPPPGPSYVPPPQPSPAMPTQGPAVVIVGPGGVGAAAFSPKPFPGLQILPPLVPPQPGQVIIGYEACRADGGCMQCDTLSQTGWLFVLLLALIFWPAAFIVCCIPSMHDPVQRPVFGDPTGAPPPQGVPYGVPPV